MIRLITDSASDITLQEAKENNIKVVAIKVNVNDKEYKDGIDISFDKFYEELEINHSDVKTMQINPFEWEQAIKECDKNDDILIITMSSKLSGTYQSALQAAQNYKNVHVVDSKSVTIGEKILVKFALSLINEGKSINEVVNELEKAKENIVLIALLDTLEYLKKGGRISSTAALIGEFLGMKPLVEVVDGAVLAMGKARGIKSGFLKLKESLIARSPIDPLKPFEIGYSGTSSSLLEEYFKITKTDSKDIVISRVGATIGSHIGPRAIAIAFFKDTK